MRKNDLLWFLAFPIYLTLGTIRHEASHALAAFLQGVGIKEFVFWPTIHDSSLRFGFVRYAGRVDQISSSIAPYLCDLLTFLIFFLLCLFISFRHRWVWLNLVIIGVLSPLVNTAHNYLKMGKGSSDVAKLLTASPNIAVHVFMVASLLLYLFGLLWIFRYSKTVQLHGIRKPLVGIDCV